MSVLRRFLPLMLLVAVVVVLVLVISWLLGQGRLSLSLPEGRHQITLSSDSYFFSVETTETSFSKIVPTGAYTITVTDEQRSFVSLVNVSSLLRTTDVAVSLGAETNRRFAVTEPRECVHPLEISYVSFACNGTLFSMVFHEPATISTPPTVRTVEDVFLERSGEIDNIDPGSIEGVFSHAGSSYVLVKGSEDFGGGHLLYELGLESGAFSIEFVRRLAVLPTDIIFSASVVKEELLFIPLEGAFVYSGSSFDNINSKSISPGSEFATSLSDYQDGLYLFSGFSNSGPADQQLATKGRIVLENSESSRSTETDSLIIQLSFCGEFICARQENGLLVILDQNLSKLYETPGVLDFAATDDVLYVVNGQGVLKLSKVDDVLAGTYVFRSPLSPVSVFTEGGRTLVSATSSSGSYLLELVNNDSTYFVDKAMEPLFESVFVESVSISQNIVFVSADLGERVYDEMSGTFKINEDALQQAEGEVGALIEASGLLENGYTLITPRLRL